MEEEEATVILCEPKILKQVESWSGSQLRATNDCVGQTLRRTNDCVGQTLRRTNAYDKGIPSFRAGVLKIGRCAVERGSAGGRVRGGKGAGEEGRRSKGREGLQRG